MNPKKWEIYWVDFNPAKGSEQGGIRPGIIVSNSLINKSSLVYMVIPLTKAINNIEKKKKYPTNVFLDKASCSIEHDSFAAANQLRPIAKERIKKKISQITSYEIKDKINDSIKFLLNLDGCHNCNNPIFPTTLKCRQCGIDVQKKCKECSTIMPYTNKYCHSCGRRV